LVHEAFAHFENYLALTGQGKLTEAAEELQMHREILGRLQALTQVVTAEAQNSQ